MARYNGSVCRLCRREGMKLFLKGDKCFKEKCPVERRNYPPGQHGRGRRRVKEYGLQLRQKQKVRRIYGLLERQFRRYFAEADRRRGITGENLLLLLERRLDSVVYDMGFASSRAQARQWITHGHILVNGRKVNIPSFEVREGNEISVKAGSRKNIFIKTAVETAQGRGIPPWIELDAENFTGRIKTLPAREDIKFPIEEQLIVELYSR